MKLLNAMLDGQKILLVEDEKFSRKMITLIFADLGGESLVIEESAAAALQYLMTNPGRIGALICDFELPDGTGLQLARAIRSEAVPGVRRNLPIAMLTAHKASELASVAAALDVDIFLTKPIAKQPLIDAVRSILANPAPIRPPEHYAQINIKEIAAAVLGNRTIIPPETMLNAAAAPAPADRTPAGTVAISLSEAKPMMVLAQDVCDDAGKILLTAGSFLSQRAINVLHGIERLKSATILVKDEEPRAG